MAGIQVRGRIALLIESSRVPSLSAVSSKPFGPPANPRLQRTPSAPLSRQPLGRSIGTLLGVLVVIVSARCASQSSRDKQPLNLNGAGVESLSGDWTGTFEVQQAGDCTVRKGSSTADTFHWTLTVQPDGAFELGVHEAGSEQRRMLGALGPGYQVTALRSFRGDCPGGTSEVRTKLVGQVTQGPGGPILELSGKETACPKSNCVFNLRYRLIKDRASKPL